MSSKTVPKKVLILLAAGVGKRMGKSQPKMLLEILGKPLLYWSLKVLEETTILDRVVVVAPKAYLTIFKRLIHSWGFKKVFKIVKGGKERKDSSRNALKVLPKDCEWVGIHDGARPFVSSALIEKCFKAAFKNGATILAIPAQDTIKMVQENLQIKRTIPRDRAWLAQTPQVFKRDLLEEMHSMNHPQFQTNRSRYTDDASLAESLGYKVQIVPGSYENIKITTPKDLILAEAILKEKNV